MSRPVRTKNGLRAISFEDIGFISHTQVYNHKIQVKFDYRRNTPIVMRVMALDLRMKNGFQAIFLKTLVYWIHISYTGI